MGVGEGAESENKGGAESASRGTCNETTATQ